MDGKLAVVLLIVLGEFWKFFTTFLTDGDFTGWGSMMNTLGIVLFTYTCLVYNEKSFYKGASIVLGTYVIINLFSVILFPGGLYETSDYSLNFFLSYRTAWFPVYLFASVVVMMYCVEYTSKASKIWAITVMLSLFVSMILVWTATGLFCFGLAAIVYFFCKIFRRGKPFSIFWVIIAEMIVFVMLVITRQQERFSFILVDVLKKDLTLTERTRIWDNAIVSISQHPLLGIGGVADEIKQEMLGYGVTHAHNFYLNTVFQYGLIGIIFQLLPMLYPFMKIRSKNSNSGLIVFCAIVALLTAYQAECFASIGYYLTPLFIIAGSFAEKGVEKRVKN